ncbi:MAG: nitrilase-related carbon-nitrogen hydrolase, partial [Lewinella sp.]|uniref:nitrilase-related carbon-nitrogen hydrolase n=1 Tax=Lewinella sp. TaxID=2004506 RepID=UPI003D6AF77D
MTDLTLTLVQTKLFWENPEENRKHFGRLLDSVEQTDLIVLPEMFTTGFSMNSDHLAEEMNGESVLWMAKMAKQKNAVITGSIIIKEGGSFYNRLIWMRPDG